ncbi:MAG: hypothetical protein ACK6DR_04255 [Gemmatimonas sp.]|jgi:hypothetical protein|uniref:hypothetical protein n=1 Tax=Gemmatimonas sp. TaxID=1962908 RepID=UPI0025BC7D3B|nr:hypothetical protein [Gemmatimonas sp.]MCE2953885.1 hypothetical protein [Gemmatimonas sp.]
MRLFLPTLLAVAVAIPAAAASLPAQPAPIVGTWNVEWEMGRQIINGEATAVIAKGTMTVVVSGDSLLATLTATSRSDNQPLTRPPFTIGGRATATGAVFTQISEATLNMNGEERKQRSIGTWTLQVNGTALTGSVKRVIEGMEMDMPPAAVTGTRAK